uniref:Uncharacterized protein n=1 Tax=Oryza nivara TaxID=4536 RepID=A0A679BE86_ORYNI|nr:hypothetical protein [Oryza sativa f. spontanea]
MTACSCRRGDRSIDSTTIYITLAISRSLAPSTCIYTFADDGERRRRSRRERSGPGEPPTSPRRRSTPAATTNGSLLVVLAAAPGKKKNSRGSPWRWGSNRRRRRRRFSPQTSSSSWNQLASCSARTSPRIAGELSSQLGGRWRGQSPQGATPLCEEGIEDDAGWARRIQHRRGRIRLRCMWICRCRTRSGRRSGRQQGRQRGDEAARAKAARDPCS